MGPSKTLSSSTDFLGAPVIRLVLLRRFRDGTRRASPVALRVLAIVLSLLTPPEWIAASVRCDHPCCLHRTVAGSASGAIHFRGHICVHFRYGPMAHVIPRMIWSIGFKDSISFLLAIQVTRLLTFAPVGLTSH